LEIAPEADTYGQGGTSADVNFGNAAILVARDSTNISLSRDIYLRFEIPASQPHPPVALLEFRTHTSNQGGEIHVFPINDPSWSESGLTWNNRPTLLETSIAVVPVPVGGGHRLNFDLTEFVHNEMTAGRKINLRMRSGGNNAIVFSSKEGTHPPLLLLEVPSSVAETWAGFPLDTSGWVDTGSWLAKIYPTNDFVYSLDWNRWMYLPEENVKPSGAWSYIFRVSE
jgi:hypothetical protein